MTSFNITLDATQLTYRGYLVVNFAISNDNVFPLTGISGWTLNSRPYTVALAPATYTFQVGSGSVDTFNFVVTPEGIITIDEEDQSYLTVEGGTKLIVRGFEVKVDARYITGQVVWNSNLYQGQPPIVFNTFRMIPMTGYAFAMQDNCSFSVSIDKNGLFQYDPLGIFQNAQLFDYSNGGFLQGQGTSTLTLLGYPLLIDARNAGGTGVALLPPDAYGGFTSTDVMFANILPMPGFELNLGYGPNPAAYFLMDLAGNIAPKTELPYRFSLDKFHGITRLTVDKVLVFAGNPVLEKEETHAPLSR